MTLLNKMYYKSVTFSIYGNTFKIQHPNLVYFTLHFFDIKITFVPHQLEKNKPQKMSPALHYGCISVNCKASLDLIRLKVSNRMHKNEAMYLRGTLLTSSG